MIELLRRVRLVGPPDNASDKGLTLKQSLPLILVLLGLAAVVVGFIAGQTAGVWLIVVGVVLILGALLAGMRRGT